MSDKEKTMSSPCDGRALEKRLRRRFADGVREFSLIEPGDHLLLGLSGGKDSMALLELLGDAKRRAGGRFEVSALHVRMDNVDYQSDTSYLERQAEVSGVRLYVKTASFEPDRNERRSPCFLCSWTRRKVLFSTAQELGCNKIALGHHQDDMLLTALMNLTYSGSFSTMPASLTMRKFPVCIIRPLCKVHEEDLREWAEYRGFRPLVKACPFEKASNRTAVRQLFDAMEALNPEARYSLWHALVKENKIVERPAEE
ncbi:pP-loop family protein [Prevotella sp. MGM2]|jgi:tRNA(Ile)-lysidine synthase TilS/MesJ|nr:pP-loop family protein [Prevotella sp. MGM2]